MNISFRSFNGDSDWAWIQQYNPILRVEDTGGLIAFDAENDKIIAACIWDNWAPNSVQCHMYSISTTELFKSNFLPFVFNHIFNKRKVNIIYAFVCSDNEQSVKRCLLLGFTEKTRIEKGWTETVDLILLELKKENCEYLAQYKSIKEVDHE